MWLLYGLISAFGFSSIYYIDALLVERYFKDRSVGVLLVISGLIGVPVCFITWLLFPDVVQINLNLALVMTFNGALYLTSLIPYLKALIGDEPFEVATMFLFISVFGLILGFVFLGEIPTSLQWFGSFLILIGGIIIAYQKGDDLLNNFNWKLLRLMLTSSFLVSINGLIFKSVAQDLTFEATFFWEYVGFFSFAIAALILNKSYREKFLGIWQMPSRNAIVGTNTLNECLAVLAKLTFHTSSLLAPLGIVLVVVEGTQPAIMLVLALFLAWKYPDFLQQKRQETNSSNLWLQRCLAVVVMTLGIWCMS